MDVTTPPTIYLKFFVSALMNVTQTIWTDLLTLILKAITFVCFYRVQLASGEPGCNGSGVQSKHATICFGTRLHSSFSLIASLMP